SPAMRHRQRAGGGNAIRYDQPLAEHFGPPGPPLPWGIPTRATPHPPLPQGVLTDFDDWLYLTQLLQARAIAIGIEWLRIHRHRCGGVLFWQLNDAWAGHSWS